MEALKVILLEFYDMLCVHHSVKSWLNGLQELKMPVMTTLYYTK